MYTVPMVNKLKQVLDIFVTPNILILEFLVGKKKVNNFSIKKLKLIAAVWFEHLEFLKDMLTLRCLIKSNFWTSNSENCNLKAFIHGF